MPIKGPEHRCKAKTKAGEPCRAAATEGGLCFFHANPKKASELGRIGGRSNRQGALQSADPLPTLDNALAVQNTMARLTVELYSGRLHPRVAAVLERLLNSQVRLMETANYEQRIARLEKLLARAEPGGGVDGNPAAP